MMSTYTLTDFRLPRPAGAGLAMTLFLLSAMNYKRHTFLRVRNVIVLFYKGLTGASPSRVKDEGGRMKDEKEMGIFTAG